MPTMNQISEQQANKVVAINENFEAVQPAALFGVDRSLSIGLVFAWYGGILYVNGTATAISAATIALTGSTTNYLERTLAGVVSKNTVGFTAGRIPLYTAVTNTQGITTLTDYRTTNYDATGRLTKSVAGGAGDVTLTAAEFNNRILNLTGVLTGNRNIIVPAVVKDFIVYNATSGAFSLTVKTAAGTGIAIAQSSTIGAALSGDGTNVLAVGAAGSGEVNTASNVGVGGVGLFKEKVGVDLQFKNLIAADPAITVTDEDSPQNEVAIGLDQGQIRTFVGDDDSPAAPESGFVPAPQPGDAAAGKFLAADGGWRIPAGGGGGTVNSASNVGTAGVGLFQEKVGTDLQFKKLAPGSAKVTVTDGDSPDAQVEIDIDEDQIRTFVGDDDSPAAPESGFVPAPQAGDAAAGKFLAADGGWKVPAGSGSQVVGVGGGRLTLTTGVPVTTSDVTGATTVYFTPYLSNFVPIYNGSSSWSMREFSEMSQATTDNTKSPAAVANNSNYDIFCWDDSGTLRATRGPAWSSSNARGSGAGTTELELVNGRYVNKVAITNGPGAKLGTYLGTIRSNGSAQIMDALVTRNVWNIYNRIPRLMRKLFTGTWTYASTSWRPLNNDASYALFAVVGLVEDIISAEVVIGEINGGSNISTGVSISLNSTTSDNAGAIHNEIASGNAAYIRVPHTASLETVPALGLNALTAIEYVRVGTGSFEADGQATFVSGIHGRVFA